MTQKTKPITYYSGKQSRGYSATTRRRAPPSPSGHLPLRPYLLDLAPGSRAAAVHGCSSVCDVVRREWEFRLHRLFCSGANPMGKKPKHQGLPIEIVHEILLNLPVKTLKRFQCVSKPWYSLISDPSFQKNHFDRRSKQDPLLLLTQYEFDEVRDTNILHLSTHNSNDGILLNKSSITVPEHVIPIQSCQGLVCLGDTKRSIIVCNPSTGEILVLPPYDETNYCIGFGYADSTNEFKVARFFSRHDFGGTEHCCEVFTLGTSEWRQARRPPQYPHSFWWGAPFLHGSIHLLPDSHRTADHSIHAFDIQSEEYTTIPLPKYYYKAAKFPSLENMCIQELRGFLYLIFSFESNMQIWLLKDYDSGTWVKNYNIDLTPMGSGIFPCDLLTIMGNGNILLRVIAEENVGEPIYCYNPRDKTFTQMSEESCSATLYVESFLPLGVTP